MRAIAITTAVALLLAGCSNDNDEGDRGADGASSNSSERTVSLMNGEGAEVGTVTLREEPSGVMLSVTVEGLEAGMNAVHLHETGDCSAADFASAGGHWNPEGNQHGRDNPQGAHLGDLANLSVGEDGAGESRYLLAGVSLNANSPQIDDEDGTALVIHAGPDDYRSDPAGDAGLRMACAVVSSGG